MERRVLTAAIFVGAIVTACVFLWKFNAQATPSGDPKIQAQQLIDAYKRHRGTYQSSDAIDALRANDFILYYDEENQKLVGGIGITRAVLEGAPPEELKNLRRMVGLLNDPAIGGMFDRAGGYFVLDEQRDAYYLMRDFPLATTNKKQLKEGMDALYGVSGMWLKRWFFRVAMIMHGHEAAPTAPVTLANPGK